MKVRIFTLALAAVSMATMLSPATAAPTAGGFASDNVEYVGFVPFEQTSSTGATIRGKYMYLTSWKNISIYDISDPVNPVQTATLPVGFMFENEEVAVSDDGSTLMFSESLPGDNLHIYDVEDKTNIVKVAQVAGAGDHTTSCILKCKYAMGSDGSLTDISDPANPKTISLAGDKNDWQKKIGLLGGAHDVREFKNGFVVVSNLDETPWIVDMRDPLNPKVVAKGDGPKGWSGERGYLWHSGIWPNNGKDRWLLMQGEDVLNPPTRTTCSDNQGQFSTFDTKGYAKTGKVIRTDTFTMTNGTYADGRPAASPAFGCSAHWFTPHETFKNQGLVAIAWYEHGTRFLNVDKKGKISEVGYFLPYGGGTSAAYWVTKDILYAVDYVRGIDILRFNGDA